MRSFIKVDSNFASSAWQSPLTTFFGSLQEFSLWLSCVIFLNIGVLLKTLVFQIFNIF